MINKSSSGVTPPQKPFSPLQSEKETFESEESNLETSQPKIKKNGQTFEQIKNYLFQETDHPAFLPPDLSSKEQEKIAELKKGYQELLCKLEQCLKKKKNMCSEYQDESAKYKNLLPQIEDLKLQKIPLLKDKQQKDKKINKLKQSDKYGNQTKIEDLQYESLEIDRQISDIEKQIDKLELDQYSQETMFTIYQKKKEDLEDFKKNLENHKKECRNIILSELNYFYKITSAEG